MKNAEPLQRRVLARKKGTTLQMVAVSLEMAMTQVMVTLLIIMMLIEGVTPHHSNSPADMAKVNHAASMPGARREDAINLIISRDGAIYFGHTATRVDDIAEQIRQKVRGGSERRAYLKVDQRAKYGDVESVVDAIRGGGIWNVALLVEQNQRATTQP
ncbi:MAG TPA: biopolymer transporter ExbD [Candidatus Acidoferrum sp.]|nr:biopolymer transporter ExbD [Candidatus Acidoferrum sp.]